VGGSGVAAPDAELDSSLEFWLLPLNSHMHCAGPSGGGTSLQRRAVALDVI